jgi:hypothetical protein
LTVRGENRAPRGLSRLRVKSRKLTDRDLQRMEEKQASLQKATQQWLSLLREMERNGESGEARYDHYFQAYLQAKRQQKRVELELFNLRQGHVD